MQSELIKAREECAMSKKYAEAKAAETAQLKQDAEEALRSARSNFEGRLQATHAELNVSISEKGKVCNFARF